MKKAKRAWYVLFSEVARRASETFLITEAKVIKS